LQEIRMILDSNSKGNERTSDCVGRRINLSNLIAIKVQKYRVQVWNS